MLRVLPSPPAHRASLPASVSPPPPRSGADAADPFERRFELRCRGAPCAPPMLFRVTSRLTLEWITPSLRPTRADGGAARRGGSAAARWQSRPAQRASAAALGALVWGRWRAAGGVRRCGWSVRVLGRRGDNPRRRGRREHGCAGAGAEGELGAASLPAGAAPGWGGGRARLLGALGTPCPPRRPAQISGGLTAQAPGRGFGENQPVWAGP